MVPFSISFLLSWHCSMSKTANSWPFIKNFHKNIQMNIRIPDVTLTLPRVSWIHLNFPSCGPQESVYHYFGGPNKLFAAWFQLEGLTAVNGFPNCLVVIVCTWKTQTWKSHWLLKFWVPRSVGEIKGYWDLYCEWVSKLPFYQKTWGNVGELCETIPVTGVSSPNHPRPRISGKSVTNFFLALLILSARTSKLLCFHAFSTWHQKRICEILLARQVDLICFYSYSFARRSYNIRSILAQIIFISRHIIISLSLIRAYIYCDRLWHASGHASPFAVGLRTWISMGAACAAAVGSNCLFSFHTWGLT